MTTSYAALNTKVNWKAPLKSPVFTGDVNGVSSGMVGLGNCNNTSDANKPISTTIRAALDSLTTTVAAISIDLTSPNGGNVAFSIAIEQNCADILDLHNVAFSSAATVTELAAKQDPDFSETVNVE